MIIELNENIERALGGKLSPKADQSKYVSTWGIKEGETKDLTGFPSQRDLAGPQPFGHGSGRAIGGMSPAAIPTKGGKGTKEHVVSIGGVQLIEMVTDRSSAEARDKWTGEVSKSRVETIRLDEIDRQARNGLKVDPKEFAESTSAMPPES